MGISKSVKDVIKSYHAYHEDTNVKVVREVEPNVYLVRITDVVGRKVSIIDSVLGNDVSELTFVARGNEDELFDYLKEEEK